MGVGLAVETVVEIAVPVDSDREVGPTAGDSRAVGGSPAVGAEPVVRFEPVAGGSQAVGGSLAAGAEPIASADLAAESLEWGVVGLAA